MKKEIPIEGSETNADPLKPLHGSLVDYRCIVQVIENGIANRKFYTVASPEQIPGYKQSRNGQKLECVQRFAEANHWHVSVNNENGWFIFTSNELPVTKDFENHSGQSGGAQIGGIY